MVKGKEEMFRADLKYFKEQAGIGGWALFERYPSLAIIVRNNIDARYQDFLSYPVKDGDKVSFHGKKYTETPHILSDLQGDELSKYQAIKNETIAHYNTKITTLRNADKKTEADFLAGAIKDVDDRFVYCYDDSVVLGVWGMKLKDSVRVDDGVYRCSLPLLPEKSTPPPPVESPTPPEPAKSYTIFFNAGENGTINENPYVKKDSNSFLYDYEIPKIEPKEGYEFVGWNENPSNYEITDNKEFIAQYRTKVVPPPPVIPWWKHFWLWLTGSGCLKWLLWALLALLLLLLLLWLLRGCDGDHSRPIPYPIEDKPWYNDAPRNGDSGGIYNPGDPYTSAPTPPEYDGILPPAEGVLPPTDGNPEIIPGNPSIIGNRLNILMENEDKSIMDFAKDFKAKYPDDKYKVVYYDNVVKRMQIEIPSSEREQMKREIPPAFAPEYELFVFDEALFEGSYTPSDPAFADSEKSWYLNAIRAPQAWDITRGSDKLTVAIVDNGFNLSHPELKSKVVMPYNVWQHSADVVPLEPDHGTHVAGVALAAVNNGKGLCGVAPGCAFMPVQVADANGLMTTTSVLDGILYALYQGADVINVSLSSQFTGLSAFSENVQTDLIINHFKEEERLWRHIMRIAASHNSTIVVAAGNDNVLAGIDAIQRPELIITVAAVDKSHQSLNKAGFSNYGPYADISAPGVGIYNSIGKNDYIAFDGTSMAAPLVTGAVALMKSLNDSLTTKQIICILQSTGLDTQGNIGKLIQINKALEKVKSGEECVEPPSPCNSIVTSGGDEGYVGSFEMGQQSGTFVFAYNTQNVPDKITLYDGVNTNGNVIFTYEGSTRTPLVSNVQFHQPAITVEIIGGDETYWEFLINCPGQKFEISNPQNSVPPHSNNSSTDARRSQLEQERNRLQSELERVNSELKKIKNNR
jgi:subtilisin family serine protease